MGLWLLSGWSQSSAVCVCRISFHLLVEGVFGAWSTSKLTQMWVLSDPIVLNQQTPEFSGGQSLLSPGSASDTGRVTQTLISAVPAAEQP